jgi:hypothetical protein
MSSHPWPYGLALGQGPLSTTKLLNGDPSSKTVACGRLVWLLGQNPSSTTKLLNGDPAPKVAVWFGFEAMSVLNHLTAARGPCPKDSY